MPRKPKARIKSGQTFSEFGNQVRRILDQYDISQTRFSEQLCGLPKTTFSDALRIIHDPSTDTLDKIAKGLSTLLQKRVQISLDQRLTINELTDSEIEVPEIIIPKREDLADRAFLLDLSRRIQELSVLLDTRIRNLVSESDSMCNLKNYIERLLRSAGINVSDRAALSQLVRENYPDPSLDDAIARAVGMMLGEIAPNQPDDLSDLAWVLTEIMHYRVSEEELLQQLLMPCQQGQHGRSVRL